MLLSVLASADDWPQWLGPKRDSVWRERGIVARFPEEGLEVKWRAPVELGYAGPAVAGGRVFLMDYVLKAGEIRNNPTARDQLEGTERVLCFDAESGKLLWKHEYARGYAISFGGGPRCTPTVDGDRVYALGAEGNLWCLDVQSGRVLWSKDFVKDYGAETPLWGVAAHPLVDGDKLFCVVGGEGSAAVAFDKHTGRELWRALSADQQGYCPPTTIEHAGTRQLIVWHGDAINGLNPQSGDVYWSVPLKPSYGMAIAAPRMLGSQLFASGYGNAAVLLNLSETQPAVDIVWRGEPKNAVYSSNVTPFLLDGTIYGCDISTSALMAVRIEDGERLWQTLEPTIGADQRGRYGTAFLVRHEDRFFLFNEAGELILARLSPERYEELDRAKVLEPTNQAFGRSVVWSHPAFAARSLFARNDRELVRVSLAAEE
jgi:outer membrane protein assembly factor BamB